MALTELDVVNEMLSTLGELPLNDLDEAHPLVPSCRRTLRISASVLQTESWWFNIETLTLNQNEDGEVLVPNDAIRADPIDRTWHLIQRGRKLYDPYNATYNIGENVAVNLVRDLAFDLLPPSAQQVVSLSAQLRFNKAYDGDETKIRLLAQEYGEAMKLLRAEHIRNMDVNILQRPSHQYTMNFINGSRRRIR